MYDIFSFLFCLSVRCLLHVSTVIFHWFVASCIVGIPAFFTMLYFWGKGWHILNFLTLVDKTQLSLRRKESVRCSVQWRV